MLYSTCDEFEADSDSILKAVATRTCKYARGQLRLYRLSAGSWRTLSQRSQRPAEKSHGDAFAAFAAWTVATSNIAVRATSSADKECHWIDKFVEVRRDHRISCDLTAPRPCSATSQVA